MSTRFNKPKHKNGKREGWGDIAHPKTAYELYLEAELRKAVSRVKELEGTCTKGYIE